MWLVIAALSLGGCLCPGERFTETAFAEMASYGPEIAACIGRHACDALCANVFQLGDDVAIERCVITSLVHQDFTTQQAPIAASTDVRLVRGASVEVTYVEQVACDDGWADWSTDDGGDDDSTDDGSTDDGSTDDGSDDDGSDDDGSDDDGSDDDGSDDDGSDDLRARTHAGVSGLPASAGRRRR
jgi:ferredoxin